MRDQEVPEIQSEFLPSFFLFVILQRKWIKQIKSMNGFDVESGTFCIFSSIFFWMRMKIRSLRLSEATVGEMFSQTLRIPLKEGGGDAQQGETAFEWMIQDGLDDFRTEASGRLGE